MRSRTRPNPDVREDRDQPRESERSQVRVPKIQYRFLKELEEKGLSADTRGDALAMAEKIRRFPLEQKHVMGSWERYTSKAIEDFKKGNGSNDERDRQHRAYAVLFSSIGERAVENAADLKARIPAVNRGGDQHVDQTRAQPAQRQQPRPPEPLQRSLGLPEQTTVGERKAERVIERVTERVTENAKLDARVEQMLKKLQQIPFELRSGIEAAARDLLAEGHHTALSARDALPTALRELKLDRSQDNTIHALTLATISRVPEHAALLGELRKKSIEEHREIVAEARMRLERYPPLEGGISLIQKDQIGAAIHDLLSPSAGSRKEALVLAQAREEIESVADPKRLSWATIAADMVSEPG